MDAAFEKMFAALNESDSDSEQYLEEPIDYRDREDIDGEMHLRDNIDDTMDDQLHNLIEKIKGINIQTPVIVDKKPKDDVFDFDKDNNILDNEVREKFTIDITSNDTNLFSNPISTTITMEGYISNVRFHEANFINELNADEDIVQIKCNFGKKIYEGYIEPVKIKRTNRGRKKKEKKKKQRKIQGDGTCFNSQITFVVRSQEQKLLEKKVADGVDGIEDELIKVYKFKVFRPGKIQLPGVKPKSLSDVIVCADKIVDLLNLHLHPGIEDDSRICKLININPVMKNYKFFVKIEVNQLIDLDLLKKILLAERLLQFQQEDEVENNLYYHSAMPHPSIFDVKYTREETKLSIKFHTPILGKIKKRTRVNIFMRGKINLLGAFDEDITRQIYEYLLDLFELNYCDLIQTPNSYKEDKSNILVDNIDCDVDNDEIFAMCDKIYGFNPIPIDENDLIVAWNFVQECQNNSSSTWD